LVVTVDLTQAGPVVGLVELDDFKGFRVLARGLHTDELADALPPIGRMAEEGDAFIDIEAVKRLAGERSLRPDWLASFDAMVDYARTHGWVSTDGRSIRAHCEWEWPAA
jgi:hypothetical protein